MMTMTEIENKNVTETCNHMSYPIAPIWIDTHKTMCGRPGTK